LSALTSMTGVEIRLAGADPVAVEAAADELKARFGSRFRVTHHRRRPDGGLTVGGRHSRRDASGEGGLHEAGPGKGIVNLTRCDGRSGNFRSIGAGKIGQKR
jgi:hypothetical protein